MTIEKTGTDIETCGPFQVEGFREGFGRTSGEERPQYCCGVHFKATTTASSYSGAQLEFFTIRGYFPVEEAEAALRVTDAFFHEILALDLMELILRDRDNAIGGLEVLAREINTAVWRGWRSGNDKPHLRISFKYRDAVLQRIVTAFAPDFAPVYREWGAKTRDRAKMLKRQPHVGTFVKTTIPTHFGGQLHIILDDHSINQGQLAPTFRIKKYENKSTVWSRHPGLRAFIRDLAQKEMRPFWSPVNSVHIPRLP